MEPTPCNVLRTATGSPIEQSSSPVKGGEKKYRFGYLIALIPALFMTMVCSSYILIAPEGLHIAPEKRIIGYVIAGLVTIGCMFGFIVWAKRQKKMVKMVK